MATKAKRNVITDSFIIVASKGAKNPFTGEVQVKHANAVLKCNGKTVEAAKKAGADSWTIRELVKRKVIAVKPPKAETAAKKAA
jgi:hypothetical protein